MSACAVSVSTESWHETRYRNNHVYQYLYIKYQLHNRTPADNLRREGKKKKKKKRDLKGKGSVTLHKMQWTIIATAVIGLLGAAASATNGEGTKSWAISGAKLVTARKGDTSPSQSSE